MRVSLSKSLKQKKRGIPNKYNDDKNKINFNTSKRAQHTRHKAGRLCGTLEIHQKHVLTRVNVKNPKVCKVCGIDRYITCGMCKASAHYFPQKVEQKSQIFFVDFHNDNFFGIARTDVDLIGREKKDRKAPTVTIKNHNNRQIRATKKDESK